MMLKAMIKMNFHSFIKTILPSIAKLHPKNKTGNRKNYPQLWYCVPGRRWIKIKGEYYPNGQQKLRRGKPRLFFEWFCGVLTGHEISKTEWGYGGGDFVDRNCRWCDKLIKVPKKEEIPPKSIDDLVRDAFNWGEK